MILTSVPEDLKGASYGNITDCPIARMLKRQFPNSKIGVGGFEVTIDRKKYKIVNPPDPSFIELCIRDSKSFSIELEGL